MRSGAAALLAIFLPATAFSTGWKTVQRDGAWWFARPDGTQFLSRGVDCVGPGVETKDYAGEKPEYSFATRSGDTYAEWQGRSLDRLRRWGFNTLAGWSDARVVKSGWPYTPVLHLGIQAGAPWVDVWEPGFAKNARRLAAELTATTRGDPALVGYFLDNEFGWADVWFIDIALKWGPGSPGKHRLVDTLKAVYRNDWKAFSRDFETTAANWDGLLSSTATGQRPGRGHRAVDAWVYEVARKYNEVCAGAVRAVDPGALVLGDRFRQFYPQAVARAARGILDAVSTNYESQTTDGWISPCYFRTLHELSGCPVVVGEFYATARENRSGNRNHGGEFTLCDTQVQRGRAAAAQAARLASMPFVIGWHWFQWCDEPTFGRGDGEDYNMGLVDIYDEPYAAFLGELVPVQLNAASLHRPQQPESARLPLVVNRQDGLVADGRLGDWDKSSPVPRALIKTESPLLPFGEIFLAWEPAGLRIVVRAYDFTAAGPLLPDPRDPATWIDLHRISIRVNDWQGRAATGLVHAEGKPGDEGHPVLFARPPARGDLSAAYSSHIDAWHYVWEVAVPAEALGEPLGSLSPGRRLQVSLTVENRGDFEKMWIDGLPIVLVGPPEAATMTTPVAAPATASEAYPIPAAPSPPQWPEWWNWRERGEYRFPQNDPRWDLWRPRETVEPRPPAGREVRSVDEPERPAARPGTSGEKPGSPAPEEKARPEKEKHRPEKPATPETRSPVPETKEVPGRPPAENPGRNR